MESKESPKATGISEITGKIVRVRHANEADMIFIEETMKKNRLHTGNLNFNDFVVAAEDGDIVGFGSLKKTGGAYEVGCILVVEEKKGRGIGKLIAGHLIEYAPVDKVFVMTDRADYFKKMGFVALKEGPKEYMEALRSACKPGEKEKVLMAFDKKEK